MIHWGRMRTTIGLLLVSVLTVAAPIVMAEPGGLKSNREQSPEIFLATSMPKGEVTVHADEPFARLPLLWASAARLKDPATLSVDGHTVTLAAGTLLPEERIVAYSHPHGVLLAFCTPAEHPERKLEHGWRAALFGGGAVIRNYVKATAPGEFCLTDTGVGGGFNELRYVDDDWQDVQPPVKIPSIQYEKVLNAPVSADSFVELKFSYIRRHSPIVKMNIIQMGKSRLFTQISNGDFYGQNENLIKIDKDLPKSVQIFGIDFDIVDIDPSPNMATVRFPGRIGADRVMFIQEDTTIHYCFGYGCDHQIPVQSPSGTTPSH